MTVKYRIVKSSEISRCPQDRHTVQLREKLLAVPPLLPRADGQPEGGEEG